MFLDYGETYVSFIILIHTFANAETFVKVGLVVVKIFGEICRFWPFHPENAFVLLQIFSWF